MNMYEKSDLLNMASAKQAQVIEKEVLELVDSGVSKTRLSTFSEIGDYGLMVDQQIVLRTRVVVKGDRVFVESWRPEEPKGENTRIK